MRLAYDILMVYEFKVICFAVIKSLFKEVGWADLFLDKLFVIADGLCDAVL